MQPRTRHLNRRPPWPYGVNRQSPQATGLVAWYSCAHPGSNRLFDVTGQFHGTVSGAAWVPGLDGGWTLDFDDVDDYATVPHSTPLLLANDLSIAFWLRGTDNDSGAGWNNGAWLAVKDTPGLSDNAWGVTLNGANLNFVAAGGDIAVSSGVTVNDGTWHHVCCTRNVTTGAMTVYVDGVNRGTQTGSTLAIDSTADVYIGGKPGEVFFGGQLEDIRLYNTVVPASVAWQMWAPPSRYDLYAVKRRPWWAHAVYGVRAFADVYAAGAQQAELYATGAQQAELYAAGAVAALAEGWE